MSFTTTAQNVPHAFFDHSEPKMEKINAKIGNVCTNDCTNLLQKLKPATYLEIELIFDFISHQCTLHTKRGCRVLSTDH